MPNHEYSRTTHVIFAMSQATTAGKSFLAQFEALALKYDPKKFRRCNVSWIKELLIPTAIWKFGWCDGLSIDR